jgi:hypothetical protein
MLILITIVAIWLGWKSHRARQIRLIVKSVQSDGYMVYYSLEDPTKSAIADATWYSRMLGTEFYADVIGVEGFAHRNLGADRLQTLADMDSMESLRVSFTEIDEESIKAIGEMSKLRILHISAPDFPPEYLSHLTNLNNLENLSITRPIGDGGVAILAQIKSLEKLTISSETLTQEGIQQLGALKNLKRLKLWGNLDVTWETKQA